MFPEDQFIPISALQHWLYCPRQCALIHLEQAWSENKFTAEGRVMHENAHEGADETKAGIRITRGMPVISQNLGLSGQCDVVEFRPTGGDLKFEISDLKLPSDGSLADSESHFLKSQISNLKSPGTAQRVQPVEYKRGKPKAHRADEVQLCAQAVCLEEMLQIHIESGSLYYGEKRRRTEVLFDEPLRNLVRTTTEEVRACFNSRRTPLAEYDPRRCDACSLIDFCQPKALRFKRGAAVWFSSAVKSQIDLPESSSSNLKSQI
jgi:CRISPR-associated exonuclease Cas4